MKTIVDDKPPAKRKGIRSPRSDLVDVYFAADFFGVSTKTIREWATLKKIAKIRLHHRTVRYRLSDLERFRDTRMRLSAKEDREANAKKAAKKKAAQEVAAK
jgi:DeoR/GlpR family transcriptional regulator of sugar metabolism